MTSSTPTTSPPVLPPPPPQLSADARWLERAILLVVVAFVAWRCYQALSAAWGFNTDDAYITLRYARNLADGHGFTWNVGDEIPVEGYSNFTFVVLGALALIVGVDPVLLLKILGVLGIAVTGLCSWLLARRWVGPVGALLPVVLLVREIGEFSWGVSGLETTTYQALLMVGLYATARAADRPGADPMATEPGRWPAGSRLTWLRVAAAASLLASLTRPEGPLLAILFGSALVIPDVVELVRNTGDSTAKRRLGQTILTFSLWFAAPYCAYFAWRVSVFQHLVPNTVLCKASFSGDPHLLIRDYWKAHAGILGYALFLRPRTWRPEWLVMVLLPAVYAVILRGADPIIGHDLRHFLAAHAAVLVAIGVGVLNLAYLPVFVACSMWERWRPHASSLKGSDSLGRWRAPALAAVQTAVVLAALVTSQAGHEHRLRVLSANAASYARRMDARAEVGTRLNELLAPEDEFVVGDAGMIPYVSHSRALDAFCLNSREWTSDPIAFDGKRFVNWVYEREPAVLVVHSWKPDKMQPRGEYGVYPALVAHPGFKQYVLDKVIGAEKDAFFYWIYRRRSGAPAADARRER